MDLFLYFEGDSIYVFLYSSEFDEAMSVEKYPRIQTIPKAVVNNIFIFRALKIVILSQCRSK